MLPFAVFERAFTQEYFFSVVIKSPERALILSRAVWLAEIRAEGKLNSYLYNINAQAQEMFDNLIVQYKKLEGVTEELKATNQMEWVRRMNNIRKRITGTVNNQLMYK